MIRRFKLVATLLVAVVLLSSVMVRPAPAGAVSCGPCPATVVEALNLRSGPGMDSEVLLVMPAGSEATWDPLQNETDGYVAVTYDGVSGWAHRDYLLLFPGTATTTVDLNLRETASLDAWVPLVIPAGAQVTTQSGPSNGFFAVRYEETSGWAMGDFLTFDEPTPGDGGQFAVGALVAVDTDALRLRDAPGLDSATLDALPYGVEGTVLEPPVEADGYLWHRVDFGAGYGAGWVAGEFLREVASDGGFAIGDAVIVVDGALNYRSEPSVDGDVIEVLADGTEGGILDGPIYADGWTWYQVGVPGYGPDGATPGWVAGEFLALS